jgi:hypothetical protein
VVARDYERFVDSYLSLSERSKVCLGGNMGRRCWKLEARGDRK